MSRHTDVQNVTTERPGQCWELQFSVHAPLPPEREQEKRSCQSSMIESAAWPPVSLLSAIPPLVTWGRNSYRHTDCVPCVVRFLLGSVFLAQEEQGAGSRLFHLPAEGLRLRPQHREPPALVGCRPPAARLLHPRNSCVCPCLELLSILV